MSTRTNSALAEKETGDWLSAHATAKILRTTPRTVAKAASANGIRRWSVPGLRNVWYLRSDVERVAALAAAQESDSIPTAQPPTLRTSRRTRAEVTR